jgi:Domain of unknown function (DUF4105)
MLRSCLVLFSLIFGASVALAAPGDGPAPAPASAPASAPATTSATSNDWVTTVDLLTMGPGDHLYMRFGHTALMVMQRRPGTKTWTSKVYNYGDADFGASGFSWRFFRGTVKFFISEMGHINKVVTLYAHMNRTSTQQRLALTKTQARELAHALERAARPENREYRYHHLEAGCASKVRDLLDQVLGGVIRKKLDQQTDLNTIRHYARRGYAGHIGAEIANDMWMGRMHDAPQTKYYAMYLPRLLSRYLQEVKVPDPTGSGKLVPLVGAPHVLFKRLGPPPTHGPGRTLIHLSYLLIVLLLGLGIWAWRGAPEHPRRAGAWLLIWALPMGLASACMVFGALVSTVIEGRINELLIVYPPTDLALIAVGLRWVRGRGTAGGLLRSYALIKVGLVVLALIGHAAGILYQEPRVMLVLALVSSVLLVLITRRLTAPGRKPDLLAQALGEAPPQSR